MGEIDQEVCIGGRKAGEEESDAASSSRAAMRSLEMSGLRNRPECLKQGSGGLWRGSISTGLCNDPETIFAPHGTVFHRPYLRLHLVRTLMPDCCHAWRRPLPKPQGFIEPKNSVITKQSTKFLIFLL